jgi:hypothetical protein
MTHTVPDPESGDQPTDLEPDEVRLPKRAAQSGDDPVDGEAADDEPGDDQGSDEP